LTETGRHFAATKHVLLAQNTRKKCVWTQTFFKIYDVLNSGVQETYLVAASVVFSRWGELALGAFVTVQAVRLAPYKYSYLFTYLLT